MESQSNASQNKRIPKVELKRVIDAQFNYERRKFIFWSFNTTYLGIAFFQIYSDVNIEGGNNPSLCIDTEIIQNDVRCPSRVYSLLIWLEMAHLCQIFCGMIGYFAIDQKSRKINKGYQYLLLGSYVYDLIVSIILMTQYGSLVGSPFENTREEFLMLLITFPLVQGIICFFCLHQFKKASREHFVVEQEKDGLLDRHHEIVTDVVKTFMTL